MQPNTTPCLRPQNFLTDEAYCSNYYSSTERTKDDIQSSINETSVDSTNTNCGISAIPASEPNERFGVISKDYFITTDQKKSIEV